MSALLEVYHSFEETPPDEVETVDGDDELLSRAPWANPGATLDSLSKWDKAKLEELSAVKLSTSLEVLAARRIVPHPRDLHTRVIGRDVMALQRALTEARSPRTHKPYRQWKKGHATGQYGKALREQVKHFQHDHGLVADGVYGKQTHAALAPFYDAYGIKLLNSVSVYTPAQRRLADLMTAAMVLYNRRGIVHYTQGPSRMMIVRHHMKLAELSTTPWLYEDCSSSVTGLRYVSGLPDANGVIAGRQYSGYGFTGTLASHGTRVLMANAPKGALFFYGSYWPYHHVTMAVGGGLVFSHGSEVGPLLVRFNYRHDVNHARVYDGLPQIHEALAFDLLAQSA